ncbi:FxLYD domain-containing protein [Bacillus sp. SA1-12]|uniref:FxLYD domain-containing protein n=1 Tax=Bacillus sp. SA1-12 TaxID=1455638 RepID=UPI0022B17A0A|nr:FxLYD domain-containing protein [Bacillus sp. SA1-12]
MILEKDDYGGAIVKGTLTNHSDLEYRYVSIDIQYYNEDGTIVESKIESVFDLKPGQAWGFEFTSYSEYTEKFDIVGVLVEEIK